MAHSVGGVILCGGRSSRMGRPKAWLPFGEELMLQRVVRLVREVVEPVVVVAAPGQALPELPVEVLRGEDREEGRGPLEGLLAGLEKLVECEPEIEAAYVTSCDVPLLVPDLIRFLMNRRAAYEVVVPVESEFAHPLAALYRVSVRATVRELLAAGELRPRALFRRVATRRVPVEELREVDPGLQSFLNLNHPEDYQRALSLAGFHE
jgi:molybdenum cofactor guanylyltransferase